MTKNDYIKQVAHLPREEQVAALEKMYKAECEIDEFSENALIICEILAIDYEHWLYKDILPNFYYDVGRYTDCINAAQEYADNAVLGINHCYLIANAYKVLKNYNMAIEYARRSNLLMVNLLSDGGKKPIDFSALPEKTLHQIASNYMIMGEIFYILEQYSDSLEAYAESWKYYPTIKSAYYLGIISYNGLDVTKNVQKAEELFLQVADLSDQDAETLDRIANSNYYLGIIYAKENGYTNREKSEMRLKKAQVLGYSISDAEIQQILESIPEQKKKSFFGFFK